MDRYILQIPLKAFCLWVTLALTPLPCVAVSVASASADFQGTIEADWSAQEKRLGRSIEDSEAIRQAIERVENLIESLSAMSDAPDLSLETTRLATIKKRLDSSDLSDASDTSNRSDDRSQLYFETRWLGRSVALKNPLIADRPLVFMKRKRFICQMLHEYLGYYYDYGDIAGGGVYRLEEPGRSFATHDLVDGRLPRGNYSTLSLSFDANTIYFAFAERAPEKPDFYSPDRRCFHVYAMDADGGNLRRLTDGPDDDFDPCPLPDGGIAFMSTRRGGFVRCNNPWEPLPTHTLHRMNADGSDVRTLSFHETSEWHPSVLHDGRIIYIRWDYVDRSAANFHGLWISNPDGSNPMALFGNYTRRINACYQPRAVPGSDKIMFLAGAHHADVGGSTLMIDPKKVRLDPSSGENDFNSLEVLTPEVCFPEAPGWPGSYFHSPWPLSEDYYLVSFSFDPLPGMGSGVKEDTETGIYLMDRFGGMELLAREPGISCMYPIPLAPRPTPPRVPSTLDPALGGDGEFMLSNIHESQMPLPEGRRIVEMRIFQVLPKSETHIVNQPRIGHANAESARMLLGTVPVENDGSAWFRAPARKPIYFQAVDAEGRAVQTMRSVTYLQPGERRGCVGCHEPRGASAPANPPLAMRRGPSRISPGPEGTLPWNYARLVQPVLDRHCVRCHDGATGEGKSPLILTGAENGEFSQSYESLKPFVRWHEWGGASIDQNVSKPGRMGADMSRLTKILDDGTHASKVSLSDADRRRLYLWLDGNVSFYGTYVKAKRLTQRRGEAVEAPALQ